MVPARAAQRRAPRRHRPARRAGARCPGRGGHHPAGPRRPRPAVPGRRPPAGASGVAAAPPRRPRFLPESLGASQKLSGDLPRLPPALARSGDSYTVLTRVCVSETGQVSSVSIERPAHPALDRHVASTLATWRYRPLLAASLPIPFCTFVRFEFKAL